MEIFRKIEGAIGEELDKLGKKILFVTLVRELGVSDEPIKKMGMKRFVEEKYNPYFDRLMEMVPNDRQKFINEKLQKVPESRRVHARNFIHAGIKDFIRREKEKPD